MLSWIASLPKKPRVEQRAGPSSPTQTADADAAAAAAGSSGVRSHPIEIDLAAVEEVVEVSIRWCAIQHHFTDSSVSTTLDLDVARVVQSSGDLWPLGHCEVCYCCYVLCIR